VSRHFSALAEALSSSSWVTTRSESNGTIRETPSSVADNASAKAEKWRLTAIEAIKQSGSPWLPQVEAPVTPREYLARGEKFELALIGSLQNDARHPREYFRAAFNERKRMPDTVGIWIGPEGDFTPAELIAAKAAGALPITLGRLVLRTETAATYALSILNYELQWNGGSELLTP